MQETPNYGLKKIELADSPPDITLQNPNWDTIDEQMKENEVNVNAVLPARTGVMQNAIINGNFEIWQRGTNLEADGYGPDRWSSLGLVKMRRSDDTPNPESLYSGEFIREGSSFVDARQHIESLNAHHLSGKTITISFWIKVISGGLTSCNVILRHPNSVDDFSDNTEFYNSSQSIDGEWRKLVYTAENIPEGVKNGLQLTIRGHNGDVSPWGVRVSQVQLNVGETALPYQPRHIAEELALCQRYFWKTYPQRFVPGALTSDGAYLANVTNGANIDSSVSTMVFPSAMRTNPTVTIYSRNTGENKIWNITTDADIEPVINASELLIRVRAANVADINTNDVLMLQAAADAEL